jgi:DNA-cytosine methyltransferase
MKSKFTLQVGELFAGAGGLSLGLILSDHPKARFQPLFAIDNDEESLLSYQHNLQWLSENAKETLSKLPKVINADVKKVNTATLLDDLHIQVNDLDLLVGGSPCQGFSSSNRGTKTKQRSQQNSLAKFFLDKMGEIRPKMFLIENVQGIGWTKITSAMQSARKSLNTSSKSPKNVREFLVQQSMFLGYTVWHGVVNAKDFGVPQDRVRFILFGIRNDLIDASTDVSLDPYLKKYKVENYATVHDAISDLPRIGNGETWNGNEYHPSDNAYVKKMRRFMLNGDLQDHFTTNHSEYVLDRFRCISQGENWKSIKKQMKNYSDIENTHSNIYRRLVYKLPAHTISHYRKSMTIHPRQHRGLSMREACRLQSFPDWFRFQGKKDSQQQQLANAVPPLMASAIGLAIADFWLDHI